MRTLNRDRPTPGDGGMSPPVSPFLPALDEGPMRAELLRQIRRLEIEISRFTVANCPYAPVVASQRRGPAILATAQLEEIRDELLAIRTSLHELVVQQVTAKVQATEGTPPGRGRLGRRHRKGA